jgi:hypothetical protein
MRVPNLPVDSVTSRRPRTADAGRVSQPRWVDALSAAGCTVGHGFEQVFEFGSTGWFAAPSDGGPRRMRSSTPASGEGCRGRRREAVMAVLFVGWRPVRDVGEAGSATRCE